MRNWTKNHAARRRAENSAIEFYELQVQRAKERALREAAILTREPAPRRSTEPAIAAPGCLYYLAGGRTTPTKVIRHSIRSLKEACEALMGMARDFPGYTFGIAEEWLSPATDSDAQHEQRWLLHYAAGSGKCTAEA